MVTMRPPFRLALRLLLVFVALWGAWQVWYRMELRRYQQVAAPMLAEADKSLQDAARRAVESDDASRYYAAAAIAHLGSGPTDSTPGSLVGLGQRVRAAVMEGRAATPSEAATLEQALTHNEVSIELADRGATLPFGGYATGTMFSFRMSGLIGVHAALALRTLDAIRTGNADAAGAAIYSRVRFTRALEEQNGSFVPTAEKAGQMLDLAADIGLWLELHPADAALQQVAAALEEPYRRDELVTVLANRARLLRDMDAETASRAGVMAPLVLRRSVPDMRATAAAVEAVRAPWPQRLDAVKRLSDDRQYVSLATQTMTIRVALGIAASRAARLAIAAVQGRRVGDTTAPISGVHLGGDVPLDPFTGDALKFVEDAAGVVVYSVGSNGTDDGGAVDLPTAAGEPIRQGADVGVRVRFRGGTAPR